MKTRLLAMGAAVFVAAALAACGGGGGGGGTPPPPPATATPTPPSTTITATGSAQNVALPANGGYSGSISVSAGTGSATLYDSLTHPAGTPVLQVKRPGKTMISGAGTSTFAANTPLLYITITAGANGLNLNATPGFTFNVPNSITGSVYLANLQGGVWTTIAGPITISGGTATFAGGPNPVSIAANTSVYLALYQGGVVPPTAPPTNSPYGCVGSSPYARVASVNPPHPIAAGDTFSYTGTIANTYAQSSPCPQPTATSASTVGSTVTVSATTLPGANGAGSNVHTVESDAYSTSTSTITTDQAVRNTPAAFQLFSSKTTDANNNMLNVAYTNPQQLDMLPEASAQSWTNDPSSTTTETLIDGATVSRTTAADGSYIDTEHLPGGFTNIITVNGAINAHARDGSGTYALNGGSLSFAAPTGGIGSGTITLTQGNAPAQAFPAWFNVGSSFDSDSFIDNGSHAFDAGCNVSPTIGTAGNQIVETHAVTDPVVGYQETRTTTSYVVAGYGAVCVKISDVLNSFYDYQRDLPQAYFSQNGQPNSTDTFVEFLTMTAPLTPYPAVRTASAKPEAVSPLTVAEHTAALDLKRALDREQMVRAMRDYLINLGKGAVQ